MEETVKYIHKQKLCDDDYLEIKRAVKGKEKADNKDFQQIPSTFFIIFATMAVIAYITKDMGSLVLYIIGAIFSSIAVLYFNFIDSKAILLYKVVFAKSIMNEFIFYRDFLECRNERETLLFTYDKIVKIYDNKKMLFIKLKGKEINYLFISKKDMEDEVYRYLLVRFKDQWKNVDGLDKFRL